MSFKITKNQHSCFLSVLKLFILYTSLLLDLNHSIACAYLHVRTIASKINVTSKGVRLSEKLQHSVMKFDRSNKFDISYNRQVNNFGGTIYFAGDGTLGNWCYWCLSSLPSLHRQSHSTGPFLAFETVALRVT